MAEETHDPIDLLRQSISSSLPSVLLTAASEPTDTLSLAAYISFPQPTGEPINLTKETPTRYTSKAGSTNEFYNVAQLWLAWTERESGVRDYLVKGQAGGVGYVSVADRRGVVEFLQSEEGVSDRVLPKGHDKEKGKDSTAEGVAEAVEAGPSKAPVKRKYEVDVKDREFCKKLRAEEVELRDRNSVMRTCGSGKVNNFEAFVKGIMADRIKAFRKSLESSGGRAPQSQSQNTDPSRGAKKARSTNPIIMISSSPTALITMWNVKKFLEQGIFEPSDQARQNEALNGNTKPEDMVPILRSRPGPTGELITNKYYVVDGVEALQKFGQDAWDRVICVLTTGQEWQFRPYKWQQPKVLFRNVTGIYFQYNNEPTNPAVKDWNVTEMRIDRTKRHTDRQVVADFWQILDRSKRR
ncbi:RNA pol II accessory factor, Cdc73 family-domain-containing protein [Papiliotrema laurentii]|uniref:RNA pol II accessory factor, Cdc73 family-domain-containing protein n=1 Tax=Papiliotrema laurentii TaxID=5418 RepID=A0AAD9CX53_PAPLA|nr:RNA pol II accessory factor, Cdc73 family-domain-containing protein [Papiliotrema laurentii]